MEYIQLGTSDLKISRIGFGTMSLETGSPSAELLVQEALEGGINFFDTADLYQHGAVESLLGRTFRGKRDQVILASKVGNQGRPDGSGWNWNPSKDYILKAIDESLKRLQTDYLDLYRLHGGTLKINRRLIETFVALQKQVKSGIMAYPPSVRCDPGYAKRSSIVSVMLQYSLIDRRPEEEILPHIAENWCVCPWFPCPGMLVSKPPESLLNYSLKK
jgi:aryl-alcohol dehydrogenase-like predicted oxidoreductase